MPDAVEACFNEQSVLDQIQQRLERFTYVQEQPMLQEFFAKFAPVLDAERNRVTEFQTELIAATRTVRFLRRISVFTMLCGCRHPRRLPRFFPEYFGWDRTRQARGRRLLASGNVAQLGNARAFYQPVR